MMKREPTAFQLERDGVAVETEGIDRIKQQERRSLRRYYTALSIFWMGAFLLGLYLASVFPRIAETFSFHSDLQVAGLVMVVFSALLAQGLMTSGSKMVLPAMAYSGGNFVTEDANRFRSRMFTKTLSFSAGGVIGFLLMVFG